MDIDLAWLVHLLESTEDTAERSAQEVILPRKTVIELIKLLG